MINKNDEVITLALCEQSWLTLRPNQLYKFEIMPDCEECLRLAEVYEDANSPMWKIMKNRAKEEDGHIINLPVSTMSPGDLLGDPLSIVDHIDLPTGALASSYPIETKEN